MNCGDVVYRSTLDPVLRMEQRGITPLAWGILSVISAYLLAPPGALAGLLDFYLFAPIERKTKTRFRQTDFVLNKKLGVGAFGVVYKAEVQKEDKILDLDESGNPAPVVLKKAAEFGAEEAWMNGRVRRACPSTCAAFIDAFEDDKEEGTWLVWKFEGKESFADMLMKKDFPYCMEPYLFSRPLAIPKGPERESVIYKTITSQLLASLRNLHNTGIVHRDIKPQNLIVSEEGKLKLIDLGAAADLRIGINYIPKEFLLDPRYCAPERFIMSTSTPSAPPTPVAALLCPILWQLNKPDKFDMYAVGLILLQMQLPSLRSDNGLIAFRKQLEGCNYNLQAWRKKYTEGRKRIRDNEVCCADALPFLSSF
ncbi:hypothetical protein CYMTET_30463 [Cymbomonas tetramitiformis]|uniref:Protein kinase domain-containing protein n=1 Tax=Cymbomonas tetramitiformis TaxID=36881 RepID=A0AAE0KTW7_9CHLO|nr:hypothetical protein CYMTET_30463 [Cymbomonas tetramitiformis]